MRDNKIYSIDIKDREKVISKINSVLFEKSEIIFAYIFGSFIEPNMICFRDIDLGVFVDENYIKLRNHIDYAIELSLELESTIKKYPIDVVVVNKASLSLAFKIIHGNLLFTKNENLWIEYVKKICLLYHDHSITSRNILKDLVSI